jgi:hypothetical protein
MFLVYLAVVNLPVRPFRKNNCAGLAILRPRGAWARLTPVLENRYRPFGGLQVAS